MMVGILFIATLILLSVNADESATCINDLIKWCESKDYRNIGQESSLSSTSVNGLSEAVSCISNSRGTKCSKNGSTWIECSPDHKVTYEGTTLRLNSRRGADDDICDASKFVNSNRFGSSTDVQEVNDEIFSDCFPFCGNNPFA